MALKGVVSFARFVSILTPKTAEENINLAILIPNLKPISYIRLEGIKNHACFH